MNPKRRQEIELIIITYLVTVMDERGWKVYAIDDGGDEDVSPKNLKDVIDTVLSVEYSVEYSVIRFEKNKRKHAAVIVLGNSGYDCISDHSFSPSDDFGQIMDEVVYPFCELYKEEVMK